MSRRDYTYDEQGRRRAVEVVYVHPEDALRLLAHGIDPAAFATYADLDEALSRLPRDDG